MNGLTFDDLKLFARVAALGTLSAVARERDVPVSQVSRSLSRIEKTSGARLIHRSTHGLALTVEGETFLDYCHRITGTLEELEGEFAAKSLEPSGLVRVAASTVIAQYQLLPSLAGLSQRYPQLRVEFEVSDRLVDMARDGIDIASTSGVVNLTTSGVIATTAGHGIEVVTAGNVTIATKGAISTVGNTQGIRVFTTSGAASCPRSTPVENDQASFRFLTFPVLISSRPL